MGGAICLLVHLRTPREDWAGTVLVVPMCRISDRIRLPWPVPEILTFVTRFAPTAPIVPTADLIEKSVKVAAKRVIAARNLQRPAEARHRSRAAARHR
jgi:acylglycerol lipase